MPDLSKTIEIIFEAVDRTGDGLRTAGAGINAFADGVGRVTGPLAGITDTIIKVDAGVAAMGAAFAAVAVNETVKFQDSLYLVQKQLGDSSVSMDKAREDIEKLATTYGINANNVAESLAGFLAAGYDYETASKLVETSTRFMIAGDLDAVKATDYLNASLAGFRVKSVDAADGAVKVGDILNKLADISSSRLLDPIAEGFSRVAPIAKTAGLSMEETGAIVARLVDVFQSGEIAGTALSSGLNSLAAPSDSASAALDKIGVKTEDASGALRNSGDILKELARKWGTLSDAQQTEAATIIFTKEQAAKFQVVLGDWAKIQDYLNQVIDKTSGAVGSMQREVEGKLKLISTAVKIAEESWRQFLEHVGAKIVDAGVSDVTKSVGLLGEAFKKVVDGGGLDPLFKAMGEQFKSLNGLIAQIAKNLPAAFSGVNWSGIIDAQNDLGSAFRRLFDGLDLTTVDGLKRAVQAVVDTGETLIRITGGIVDGLRPFFEGLVAIVDKVNSSDSSTKEWAGNILGLGKGINTIIPAISSFGSGVSALGTGLEALAAIRLVELFGSWSGAASSFANVLGKAGLVGAAGAAGYAVGTVLAEGIDKVLEYTTGVKGQTLGSWIYDLVHGSEDISAATQVAAEGINALSSAAENAKAPLDGLSLSQTESMVAVDDLADKFSDLSRLGLAPMTKEIMTAGLTVDEFGNNISLLSLKINDVETKSKKTGDAVKSLGKDVEFTNSTHEATVNVMHDASGAIIGYSQAVGTLPAKLNDAAEKTDKATKKTESLLSKMEEIASNERIKNIEANVKLNVAQLETDAKRVESVFDSIDNTVKSTGDLLGSLFGDLSKAGRSQQLLIEDQIQKENRRRDDVLELQKRMTEAEINRVSEQARALARGDSLIQIDGSGLAPQLEAFMWEVLKAIRVKANSSFQDYLLGMSA